MGAQADPEVYHWSSRSVTGSAGRREASCCHRVASRTLFDNRVLSCKIVMSHLGNSSGHLDPYSSGDASGGRLAGMVVGFPRRRGHRYWGKRPPEESPITDLLNLFQEYLTNHQPSTIPQMRR